ncbi:hypothetical protein M9H77_04481 [Catharanthus roseus]|uniref:Uncharacterized protein n=1 Tax=Catharanthus roseus TaxID=4058 RepID=A0ACC0CEM0_CATRO|nr:hypothetical protein M9H77_04481 [Catharanthus roseus]
MEHVQLPLANPRSMDDIKEHPLDNLLLKMSLPVTQTEVTIEEAPSTDLEAGIMICIPWLILGDFNQVLTREDKQGGLTHHLQYVHHLWDTIETCSWIDLGFSGPAFTWTNSREGEFNIMERTDRGFVITPDDLILFGEASLSQARIMADILKLFCLVSRQKINTQKSLLFTSWNTPNHTRSLLSHTFDILFTEDLGLYLELRILGSMPYGTVSGVAKPIRWILGLHGDIVVPFSFAGILSGNVSHSLRNTSSANVEVASAESYDDVIQHSGSFVDVERRKKTILENSNALAESENGRITFIVLYIILYIYIYILFNWKKKIEKCHMITPKSYIRP